MKVILTTSLDRRTEAFALLRELRPYLVNLKPLDRPYGDLMLRLDRLLDAERRGSDGDIT